MSEDRHDVAVIGAGMGGLAAAQALRQIGLGVAVFEQAPEFARVGAGIQLSPNACRALDAIGALESAQRDAVRPMLHRSFEWRTGQIDVEVPLADAVEARFGAPYLQLHRADLHSALLGRVQRASSAAEGDVRVATGRHLVDLVEDSNGVQLRFSDGPPAAAALVIGADGVRSTVRELLFGPADPIFAQRVAYRSTLPASAISELDIPVISAKWWGVDRHFVHYYVDRCRELNFVAILPADEWRTESWTARGDVGDMIQALDGFHEKVQAIVRATTEVYKWALFDREPLDRWSAGRIALLGDAAHPMLPHMAQGAAMALEDAVMLARCVAEDSDPGSETGLRRYEASRRERTNAVQAGSRANSYLRADEDSGHAATDWVWGFDAATAPLAEPAAQ